MMSTSSGTTTIGANSSSSSSRKKSVSNTRRQRLRRSGTTGKKKAVSSVKRNGKTTTKKKRQRMNRKMLEQEGKIAILNASEQDWSSIDAGLKLYCFPQHTLIRRRTKTLYALSPNTKRHYVLPKTVSSSSLSSCSSFQSKSRPGRQVQKVKTYVRYALVIPTGTVVETNSIQHRLFCQTIAGERLFFCKPGDTIKLVSDSDETKGECSTGPSIRSTGMRTTNTNTTTTTFPTTTTTTTTNTTSCVRAVAVGVTVNEEETCDYFAAALNIRDKMDMDGSNCQDGSQDSHCVDRSAPMKSSNSSESAFPFGAVQC